MEWNFNKVPVRLRNKLVNEWRKGNIIYTIQVVKEHGVFGADCINCLRDQLKQWITWSIEDPRGPLYGYGDIKIL